MLDPKLFWRDTSAKSLSLFCLGVPAQVVDDKLVADLVEESEKQGRCNARICLHDGPDSNFHEMIILERKTSYFPPHRHVGKAQSCHIMRGRAAVFIFEDDGRVERCVVLGGEKTIVRIGENRYHFTLPLSEFVIYHEGKPGPFLPEGDSIFAEWAPGRSISMTPEIENYLSGLRAHIR